MKLYRAALVTVAASLFLAGFAAAAGEVYREYFPRLPIDPAKGYLGDENWSGTVQYWKDAATLARNLHLAKDHDSSWKLNFKFMDLDRGDLHSGHIAVDEGEALVKGFGHSEPAFLTCLGEGGTDLRGLGATYPKFDPKLGRIITVDSRVEHCARTALRQEIRQGTPDNVRVTSYIKSLSAGAPMSVDLRSKPIVAAYARGERLYFTKAGQFNLACASCHSPQGMMGKRFRGETSTTPFADAAHFPAYRIPRGIVESMHERFRTCNRQSRTFPLPHGDPAYVDLEVFLSVLANGYPISVPVERP